jgi:hypothetical protein
MGSFESGANSGQTELERTGAKAPVAVAASASRGRWRSWTILLAAGLVAGLVAWVAGEWTHGHFRARTYSVEVMGIKSMQPSRESQKAADIANAALASAILGSMTALTMGLAGGLTVRAPWRGAIVGLGAQVVGAFAAAGASLALIPIFFRQLVPDSNDLLTPILIHGGIWTAIGVVGGIAFAAGMNSWRHLPAAVFFACVGAFTASIIFHVLTGMLFPHSSSAEPVGGSAVVRLLATSLVTVLVAIGVAQGTLVRPLRPADPGPTH